MKTDEQLKQDVQAELAWDPAVKSTQIGVAVKDGIVTLTGHLETYDEKWAVERVLRRIPGVRAIALELDVRLSPDHVRSDTEIAQAARQWLRWHSQIPPAAVRLTVDRGWITLQGELDWDYQRELVVKALRHLKGVVGVSNEMTIKPRAGTGNVVRRIEEALGRQAQREAHQISVEVRDGTAILRGRVGSWRERAAAQGAAFSAPGITAVLNELRVE